MIERPVIPGKKLPEDRFSILLVDDNPQNLMTLEATLDSENYFLMQARSGQEVLKIILEKDDQIGLIILDVQMPGMDGFETAKIIKERKRSQEIPIIFLSAFHIDETDIFNGYDAGCFDYLTKPFSPKILQSKVKCFAELFELQQQLIRSNQKLEELSKQDGLTQVYNRYAFDETLEKEIKRAARNKSSISLIILDIDFFKKFNDSYGHVAGDVCLQNISNVLRLSLNRPSDFLARFGGEEFCVILPETSSHGCGVLAETLRKNVEESKITVENLSTPLSATISLGCSTLDSNTGYRTASEFIMQADNALYQAKKEGRNRVATSCR